MSFSFTQAGCSVFHNGKNLLVVAALATPDTISQETSNLTITVTDLTNLSANPVTVTLTNADLSEALLNKLRIASINEAFGLQHLRGFPAGPRLKQGSVLTSAAARTSAAFCASGLITDLPESKSSFAGIRKMP